MLPPQSAPLVTALFEEPSMPPSISRRGALIGAAVVFAVQRAQARSSSEELKFFTAHLTALEEKAGGRLGIAVFDTGSGKRFAYRGDERFPMCSTFKVLVAAAILARADAGKERLDRRLSYGTRDLLDYAPVTRAHIAEGSMTLEALCAAAIEMSDNTAANLLLQVIGGPPGLTAFLRSQGDERTRLDRNEPELNESAPNDERDTTTPTAMLATMDGFLIGDALTAASRVLLQGWMINCKTGAQRLPASIPNSARIGHKTGSGERGTSNDIAIVWPAGRKPVLITTYLTGSPAKPSERDAVIAECGQIAFASL
jgi:beta-lactamase class A